MALPERARRLARAALQLAISGALVVAVLHRVPIEECREKARRVSPWLWGAGLLATAAAAFLDGVRTVYLSRMIGRRITLGEACRINLVSSVYAFLFLGWLGGGGYRVWRLTELGFRAEEGILLITLDRAASLLALVLACVLLLGLAAWAPAASVTWILVVLPLLLLALGMRLSANTPVVPLSEPEDGMKAKTWRMRVQRLLAERWGQSFAVSTMLAVPALLPVWAWSWAIARECGAMAPTPWLLAGIALMALVQQVPVSFAGIGIREIGFEWLFARWGAAPGAGAAFGAIQSVLVVVCIALCLPLRHVAPEPPRADG